MARAGLIGDLLVSCCVPFGTQGVVLGFHEGLLGDPFVSCCVSSGTPGVALDFHESFFYGHLWGARSPQQVCRPRGEHPPRAYHIGGPGASWARFPYSDTLPRTPLRTSQILTMSMIWRPWRLLGQIPLF